MKRILRYSLFAMFVLVLSYVDVWAQGTAQISGSVRDQSGALLPGATITATRTETGIARSAVSNETGFYVLPSLPLGQYKLEVSLSGFRTFVQSGIILQVNSNPVIDAVLAAGQRAEVIEVQANTVLVETRGLGVGQTMETQRILELPLNGRNVTELITLGGGANDVPQYSSQPRSMQGQRAISVAGGLASGVNYALDGAMHTNAYDHLSLPLPFPDALQEFKVETSALSASQGQHSGAQVNAVTKSGSNDFHGSLFEFVRNDLLNATEYFARVDPATGDKVQSSLKRNQFGGTIGGAIVRNKLFFFAGYQGTTERSDPANVEGFVPTAAMLEGDFSTVASAACGRQVSLNPQFFSNNHVDPALFHPVAKTIVDELPETSDPCGRIVYGLPNKSNNTQITGRTDWQLNPAHSVMGRVLFTRETRPVPYELAPDNLLTTNASGRKNFAQSYAIGDTWVVSPLTVVSTRLVANYTDVQRLGAEFFSFGDVGVKNYYSYQPNYMQLTVNSPGFSLGGAIQNTSTYRTFSSGINVDASLSRGAHQWTIGGALQWTDSNSNANVNSSGRFTFTGARTGVAPQTGLPLADFLLGLPATFVQSAPNTDYMRKWYTALYVGDSWKVARNWTLGYGLRWEPDLAETLTLGRVATYSEERRAAGTRSTVFPNAPAGFSYPGDPGFEGKRGRKRNLWTFAPRFGFAWDVQGDGRTSVRASVGLAYDYPNAQYHLWTSIIPPFGSSTTLNNPSFDDPWAAVPGGNPFPKQFGPTTPFVPNGNFTVISNIHPAQAQSWNLTVQRQFGNDWLATASYLGSHTIHMLGSEQLNPAFFFPGVADASGNCSFQGYTITAAAGSDCSTFVNTNTRRRLTLIDRQQTGQYVQNLVEIQSGGNASYNGLLLGLRKRAAKGITIDTNYTWSHCIGAYQANEAGDTGANPDLPQPFPGNRDARVGNCLADLRHVFNLSSVLETPPFANNTLRIVASGWRLSPLYRYHTGTFINVVSGGNNDFARDGTNINNQPAVYQGGDPIGDHSAGPNTFWLNKAAFANPAVGTLGNVGTRTVAGPSQWDFDIALSRSFQLHEARRLELRWEVYNVTNSFRAADPNDPTAYPAGSGFNDVTNQLFGKLRIARPPRIMQFALKYVF